MFMWKSVIDYVRSRQLGMWLLQPEESALAEYSIVEDHRFLFDKAEVLARP